MISIHLISDVHMQINAFTKDDLQKLFETIPKTDVIVVAGDIESPAFIRELASEFKDSIVLYVLGNHDYYYHSLENPEYLVQWKNKVNKKNAFLLNRSTFSIDNKVFLGLTLWSKAIKYPEQVARISCFRKIAFPQDHSGPEERNFDHQMMSHVHSYEKEIIKHTLWTLKDHESLIPITHFCPRDEFIKPKWENDKRNEYFSANMGNEISNTFIKGKIPLWMFGHMHDATDQVIDGTRYVCNPYGCFNEIGNNGRVKDLIIQV